MAVKMPAIEPMKAGSVVLFLLNLAAGYFLYVAFSAGAMSELKPFVGGAAPIKIDVGTSNDSVAIKTGFPPRELLVWDPFQIPKGVGEAIIETGVAPPRGDLPVPTDNIRLHGIIKFNGSYRALISVGGGAALSGPGGSGQVAYSPSGEGSMLINPPEEIRKGMILPGTTDIRAEDIRGDGVLLTQPGAVPTFLPLSIPGLPDKKWYRGDAVGSFRGRFEMSR